MKKIIVTATIMPVTEAVDKFQRMLDWELIVVGDKKTPANYKLNRGTYLTPAMQEQLDKELSEAIGWNCIQRRSMGLVLAHQQKADIVAVVDDDNIPYEHWGTNLLIGKSVSVQSYQTDLPAFDPVGATNEKRLWHRGYPLELLSRRDYTKHRTETVTPDVQADFWNGDPDIDAICRMEHAPECDFESKHFPMASNKISPFNSQNTFLSGKLLQDYFLFPHVGRMDDIWASYYVQAKGAKVVYGKPSVYQRRNPHNLIEDLKKEYIGYENNLALVQAIVQDPDSLLKYLPARSQEAFRLYRRHFK